MVLLRIAACAVLLASCTFKHSRYGDENLWRHPHSFEPGRTTMAEVLRALGPPTQVYDFDQKVVLYYVLLEERSVGFNIEVYKATERAFHSDRAVYFFERNGVLEEMATSAVALPTEAEYEKAAWREVEVRDPGGEVDR